MHNSSMQMCTIMPATNFSHSMKMHYISKILIKFSFSKVQNVYLILCFNDKLKTTTH